jgi:hypothetical protein
MMYRPPSSPVRAPLKRSPTIAAAIREGVQAGTYDVCGHGLRWERHQGLSFEAERDAIHSAYDAIGTLTGVPPAGWYCRYAPTQNTRRIIVEHGGFPRKPSPARFLRGFAAFQFVDFGLCKSLGA